MKNKKNLKGFTLVELVIVATIMVMIMGSAMNFIQPLNNFYKRTQNLADSNDVGSVLMDSVDNNMRFATNMVILQDYEGVPYIDDGYLCDSTGNPVSEQMTDVIIIDNDSIRGSIYVNDGDTSSIARRKGATGNIMKASLLPAGDPDGIDFNHIDILGQEGLYSDFKAEFNATLNGTDEKNKCVSIDMTLWKPELDRSTNNYVFDKIVYQQTRDLELVNINMTDAAAKGMSCKFYTSRVDDEGHSLGEPLDYSMFPNAAENGTESTDGQRAMYGSGVKRTYIFYSKAVVIDSPDSTVRIGVEDADTHEIIYEPQEVNAGDTIDDLLPLFWDTANDPSRVGVITDGGIRYNVTLQYIKTPTGVELNNFYGQSVFQSFNFKAKYIRNIANDPVGTYEFWEIFNSSGVYDSLHIASDGTAYGNIYPDELGGDSGYVSAPGAPYKGVMSDGTERMPHRNPGSRWISSGSTNYSPDVKYSGDMVWSCVYEDVPKATFEFKDESGSTVGGPDEFNAGYDEYERCTDPAADGYYNGYRPTGNLIGSVAGNEVSGFANTSGYEPAAADSKHFDHWDVVDTTDSTNLGNLSEITTQFKEGHTYECTAVMVEDSVAPTDRFTLTDTQVAPNQFWRDTYILELTNTSDEDLRSVSFVVTFDGDIDPTQATTGSIWLNPGEGRRYGTGSAESFVSLDSTDPKKVKVDISVGESENWKGYVKAAGGGVDSTVKLMIQFAPATKGTVLNVENIETVSATPR